MTGEIMTEYICCDLCGKSLRLGGSENKRIWSNLDGHQGIPICLDRQRSNQRASALERDRQVAAGANAALALHFGVPTAQKRHGVF